MSTNATTIGAVVRFGALELTRHATVYETLVGEDEPGLSSWRVGFTLHNPSPAIRQLVAMPNDYTVTMADGRTGTGYHRSPAGERIELEGMTALSRPAPPHD